MCRKYHIPVLANGPTWKAMERKIGEIPAGMRITFDSHSDFYLGDIGVAPFLIPHDAAEPVGFRLYNGNTSIATATDLWSLHQDREGACVRQYPRAAGKQP